MGSNKSETIRFVNSFFPRQMKVRRSAFHAVMTKLRISAILAASQEHMVVKRAEAPWSVEEFFRWDEQQEDRHELVNGFSLKMQARASNVHNDIKLNVLGELLRQFRGSGCHPFDGDGSVQTKPRQIRSQTLIHLFQQI